GEQLRHLLRCDARTVFGEEAPLGHGVEATEQSKSLIGDQRHDVAFALNRPQLERQGGAQRMVRGDHAGAWQLGIHGQRLTIETDQVGNEQEQAANPGDELSWRERKLANIGDGLLGGPDRGEPLFVYPPRQSGKALLQEDLSHRSGSNRRAFFLERSADVVDGVVALAQPNHLVADFALLGLLARSRAPHGKELWQLTTTELVTKHAKCRWGVAEPSRRLGRGQPFQEVGPQGFVLALAGRCWLFKEAAAVRQDNWETDRHVWTVSIFANRVNDFLFPIHTDRGNPHPIGLSETIPQLKIAR